MRLFQISISAQAVASGRCAWISSVSGKSYLYSVAAVSRYPIQACTDLAISAAWLSASARMSLSFAIVFLL
ncbi:MAG: hypothetical protein IKF16_05010, partial [Lachnospiraceae bacterium]|nr:hypothetical protein [Lachnospiraceae bacterium]